MHREALGKWSVVAAAVAQVVGGWLPSGADIGQTVASRSAVVTTPVTPAGYAFSIWGVIFALALAFAVYQLLVRDDAAVRRVRAPFALACAANAAWEVYVQLRGIDGVSVVIIAIGLAAAAGALARLSRSPAKEWTWRGWLVFPAVGLLAGWLSVAAFANTAAVMEGFGVGVQGPLAVALILAAAVLSAVLSYSHRGRIFVAVAAGWGLAAVIVRNLGEVGDGAALAAACAGILLVATATLVGEWRGRRAPRPV